VDLTELIADACKLAHVSRDFVMSFALLPEEYSMHIWAVPTLSLSYVGGGEPLIGGSELNGF